VLRQRQEMNEVVEHGVIYPATRNYGVLGLHRPSNVRQNTETIHRPEYKRNRASRQSGASPPLGSVTFIAIAASYI